MIKKQFYLGKIFGWMPFGRNTWQRGFRWDARELICGFGCRALGTSAYILNQTFFTPWKEKHFTATSRCGLQVSKTYLRVIKDLRVIKAWCWIKTQCEEYITCLTHRSARIIPVSPISALSHIYVGMPKGGVTLGRKSHTWFGRGLGFCLCELISWFVPCIIQRNRVTYIFNYTCIVPLLKECLTAVTYCFVHVDFFHWRAIPAFVVTKATNVN